MYSAKAIANYFLDRGYDEDIFITPMKMNKLVYLAHGWYLAFTETALVNEMAEAWDHGPVFPSLYHEFKKYGRFPIDKKATTWHGLLLTTPTIADAPDNKSFPTQPFLDKIWELYRHWHAKDLRSLSHKEGSPWHTVKYSPSYRGRRVRIDDTLIFEYYKQKLDAL